jgi:hypothetical protein
MRILWNAGRALNEKFVIFIKKKEKSRFPINYSIKIVQKLNLKKKKILSPFNKNNHLLFYFYFCSSLSILFQKTQFLGASSIF